MAVRRMLTGAQSSSSRSREGYMHTSSLQQLLLTKPKSEEASHPTTQMDTARTESQQAQDFNTTLTKQNFMRTRRGETCPRSKTASQASCDHASPPITEQELVLSPETWKAYVESFGEVFDSTWGGCSLALLQQPEVQHRARYLTEGSRGPIKNRTNDGHPRIQLRGWNGPALLQVFVANGSGDPKLNMFYQVCLVSTKSNRGCMEKTIGHTTVVQVPFHPDTEDRTLDVDCVGLVKLRNSDVERRLSVINEGSEKTSSHHGDSNSEDADMKEVLTQSSPPVINADTVDGTSESNRKSVKPKSSSARLVYRVLLLSPQKLEGVVQVISDPILCTQIIGSPEICLMSTKEAPETGGGDLFIIGKNLVRGSRIVFRELSPNGGDFENSAVIWEREADLDPAYLYQTHAICRIPRYDGPSAPLTAPLSIVVFVETPARVSRPETFVYLPTFHNELPSTIPPNILRMSLEEAPVSGGVDLFIIGKGFTSDNRVIFRQISGNQSLSFSLYPGADFVWKEQAHVDTNLTNSTHIVCRVPPYDGPSFPLTNPITIEILVETASGVSQARMFTYTPDTKS